MRARARWGITPLLAAPAGAWALGLGDIELQSALNQPFRAEIALSATTDEMQGLRVTLAAPDTFDRYGLDRPGFLNGFEFRVVADRSGRNVVQITSRESIAEPFVTLLLEATWPRGRTLREYTVLLDPPVLLPGPATSPAPRPAETRSSGSNAPGGAISRPARRRHRRQRRHRHRPPANRHRTSRGRLLLDTAFPGCRYGRRVWPGAASRDALGDRGSTPSRRRHDQSNDDRDLPVEPRSVRRQHQCVARRRDAAPARDRRLRHARYDRRERRGSAADGRVGEPRAAKRPATAVAAGRDRGRARTGSGTRGAGTTADRIATCGRRCGGSCRCGRRRGQSAADRAQQCRAAKLAAGSGGSRGARGRAARRRRVGSARRRARIRATVRG